jgi:hypothetical protein
VQLQIEYIIICYRLVTIVVVLLNSLVVDSGRDFGRHHESKRDLLLLNGIQIQMLPLLPLFVINIIHLEIQPSIARKCVDEKRICLPQPPHVQTSVNFEHVQSEIENVLIQIARFCMKLNSNKMTMRWKLSSVYFQVQHTQHQSSRNVIKKLRRKFS